MAVKEGSTTLGVGAGTGSTGDVAENLVAGVVAVVLLAYLVYVLVHPDRF